MYGTVISTSHNEFSVLSLWKIEYRTISFNTRFRLKSVFKCFNLEEKVLILQFLIKFYNKC